MGRWLRGATKRIQCLERVLILILEFCVDRLEPVQLIVREIEIFALVDEQLDRTHVLDVATGELDAAAVRAIDGLPIRRRVAADSAPTVATTAATAALGVGERRHEEQNTEHSANEAHS